MKRKRYSVEQIVAAVRQHDLGVSAADINAMAAPAYLSVSLRVVLMAWSFPLGVLSPEYPLDSRSREIGLTASKNRQMFLVHPPAG